MTQTKTPARTRPVTINGGDCFQIEDLDDDFVVGWAPTEEAALVLAANMDREIVEQVK